MIPLSSLSEASRQQFLLTECKQLINDLELRIRKLEQTNMVLENCLQATKKTFENARQQHSIAAKKLVVQSEVIEELRLQIQELEHHLSPR